MAEVICLGPNCKKGAGRDTFCSKICESAFAINGQESAINTPSAINEERLTDAINRGNISGRPAGWGEDSRDGGGTMLPSHRPTRDESRVAGSSVVVPSRTPNRRSREAYNSYMRDYMKVYRGRRGT